MVEYWIGLMVLGILLFVVAVVDAVRQRKSDQTKADDKVRFVYSVTEETQNKLETLAKRANTTTANVIERAVVLFEAALEAKEKGLKVGSVDGEGKMVDEVVNVVKSRG